MIEAVWATALARMADGFHWSYLAFFIAGCAVSLGGLMWSMRDIPMGTAYAAWADTGAVTTVAWAAVPVIAEHVAAGYTYIKP